MISKWMIHRVGLLNFWYYDEEEFYFLDGRMLLRGANGSGKSVTMQSFIPLLLDGNMRPERLDPFGSRARRMDNYLLEENDTRQERTAYLYMEFKRRDSETYLTIGIGMRARKNRKLDTWYFYISDGRRIGKDFYLYKEVQGKIPYSKQELKNRIDEGGKLIENQGDYMENVNKLIFGFETIEEYKEMIDLLIQLRTPKLSKDFKPSIINEILSNSLQPLSEDDLRPMTEAIENMDNLKTNVDNLKTSLDGARRIERIYDKYNQIILYDKGKLLKEEYEIEESLNRKTSTLKKEIEETTSHIIREEENINKLLQEEKVLKEEEETLNASDAKGLKEKEESLHMEIKEQEKFLGLKKKYLEEKREKWIEERERQKDTQEKIDAVEGDIEDLLRQMEEKVEKLSFDEHTFMMKDILNNMEVLYSFDSHKTLLRKLIKNIEDGLDALKEEERVKRVYDSEVQSLDITKNERDIKQRELLQYENQLIEIKSELKEKLNDWESKNEELKLPKEVVQQLTNNIDQFNKDSDYGDLRELVRGIKIKKENQLNSSITNLSHRLDLKDKEVKEKHEELKEWINKKDPEPEQSEAVRKNRKVLKEMGIHFYEFYKTIEYDKELSKEEENILEEALLSMGILDSLIVDAKDRDKVLSLDKGLCDKYIFTDIERVKDSSNSLSKILEISNEENDIMLYYQISQALNSIGYKEAKDRQKENSSRLVEQKDNSFNKNDTSYIDKRGNYKLGVVTGTVTKEYEAKYIGVKTRESYKQRKIKELETQLHVLKGELETLLGDLNEKKGRVEKLNKEMIDFPDGIDLRIATKEYYDGEEGLKKVEEEIRKQEDKLQENLKELTQVREKVRKICGQVYLPARLDLFLDAKECLEDYGRYLTDVQIKQERYCNYVLSLKNREEKMEEIDGDIDELLYDINRMEGKYDLLQASLLSVQEQLELTNYEEIRERLDYLIDRLFKIPKEREDGIILLTNLKNKLDFTKEEYEKNKVDILQIRKKVEFLSLSFANEYRLGYVFSKESKSLESSDNSEKIISLEGSNNSNTVRNEDKRYYQLSTEVVKIYQDSFGMKSREDFLGDLQRVFHENRGYLLEYHLNIENLSDNQEEKEFQDIYIKRLDIVGKYRGVTVKFKELLEKLKEDIEEQENLLNEQDRELFEDILTNTISKKIRAKIYSSNAWVDKMNQLMSSMRTSSGLTLSLRWRSKSAEHEEQIDTRELVELLKKDAQIMKEDDFAKLSLHFRSKIKEARKTMEQSEYALSFHGIMREILDYRKWFEFQLECKKIGENKKVLTDRVFFTFSGGEKAMSMYVPLFSAVIAKYQGGRKDAPRLISLDEAFAGVDETNINDMFRLMVEFDFDFIINSQILYGDYESVPSIAIYQLLRPENAKYVTVINYIWNGKSRELIENMEEYVEQ